jgi:hypothetical protein
MREGEMNVLHVAAMGDHQALETLCHAARVVDSLGASQVVIAMDGCGAEATWPHRPAAEMRTLGRANLSLFGTLRALQRELARHPKASLYAVHLHGMKACLLGSLAMTESAMHNRVVYSPHPERAASPFAAAILRRLWQSRPDAVQCAVTASLADAPALSRLANRSADVLPHPVGDEYFRAAKAEEPTASVLADGFGREAADVVSRLSVLLNGRTERVPISWLGEPGRDGRAQLEASGVEVLGVREEAEKAQRLSRAWAFVHISSSQRLPIAVEQAMAAGLPCLVGDTSPHRALVCHGETGFICTSERDLLETLVLLLRDPIERRHVGEAARADAARRFTWPHFERALLRAYGFSRGSEVVRARQSLRALGSPLATPRAAAPPPVPHVIER